MNVTRYSTMDGFPPRIARFVSSLLRLVDVPGKVD